MTEIAAFVLGLVVQSLTDFIPARHRFNVRMAIIAVVIILLVVLWMEK